MQKSHFSGTPLIVALMSTATIALVAAPARVLAQPAPMSLLSGPTLTVTDKPATLTPPTGKWDLSRYDSLYLSVRNTGRERVTVWAKADNPTAQGTTDTVRTAIALSPGETKTMRLRLMRRPQDPGYEPFQPFFMYFKALNVRDNTLDPAQVSQVSVYLDAPTPEQSVVVESVKAQGEGGPLNPPFLPFVDKYGQYKHTDWPDKIYSDADFEAVRKKDAAEMAAYPGPADWDKWGGWTNGPKQRATGFFRTQKVSGKWWLVTPDGSLFWSYGATGVNSGGQYSPVTGKETWFEELPSPDGPTAKYWAEGKGARFRYYAQEGGRPWKSFSFSSLNAERKYGPNWREATADALHARLRNWGLNTIANWSDPVVYLKRKTPYTATMNSGPWSLDHFPDVFDPAWEKSLNDNMDKQKDTTANDPWNIGYFVDNELTWGSSPRAMRVTQGVLKAVPSSPSKIEFVKDLKAKYTDIGALNTAWNTSYASWEALLEAREIPKATDPHRRDMGNFGMKMADKYFRTVRDAIKRVAPNNLYLGCRFHGTIQTDLMRVAAKYCDVIGYNIYALPNGTLNQYRSLDKPFIVGEFGVTSDLGQTPWRGGVMSQEQGERLKGMERWLNQGFTHPNLVGAHFFQFRDQALTGRDDGEATLRGFLNVADTPHFDLVQLNRRLAYQMYATRSGVKP